MLLKALKLVIKVIIILDNRFTPKMRLTYLLNIWWPGFQTHSDYILIYRKIQDSICHYKMRTGNMSYVIVLGIKITHCMANSVVNTTLWKATEFGETIITLISLQWRHNGCDGISNDQPHDCLLNRWFRRRSKKTLKLRVTGLCAGNSPVTGEFLTKG